MRFPPPVQQRDPADDDTPHISVSQAALIERCPLAWRFKYVDNAPQDERPVGDNLTLGIALDRACEAWYANGPEHIACTWDERAQRAFQHIAAVPEPLAKKARDMWVAFMASPVRDWVAAPFGVQRRHTYDLGGLAVIGYSDLIRNDGAVVDFKYGGRPTDAAWMRQVIRQVTFYRLSDPTLTATGRGLIVRFGGRVQPEVIDFTVGDGDVAECIAWLDAARTNGYDAQYHPARPGSHCGWCPYREASCAPRQVALAAIANGARGRTWE